MVDEKLRRRALEVANGDVPGNWTTEDLSIFKRFAEMTDPKNREGASQETPAEAAQRGFKDRGGRFQSGAKTLPVSEERKDD